MAPPTANPYITVPPPPLPEFYRTNTKEHLRSHMSPSAQSTAASDGTDCRPRYDFQSANSTAYLTAPAAARSATDVPPLAVYHICRICLRPRSARYHRDHPIPMDGMPPPPGICRRCRVSSLDEIKSSTEVIEQKESNKMRIGIASLVPEADYFSASEMKDLRPYRSRRKPERQQVLFEAPGPREATSSKHSHGDTMRPGSPAREEVIDRHTHITDHGPHFPRLAPSHAPISIEKTGYTIRTKLDKPNLASSPEAYKMITIPPPPPRSNTSFPKQAPSEVRRVETIASSDTTHASEHQIAKGQAFSHKPTWASRAVDLDCSESEIRRLAREEVVHYRQAERKLEAHSDPYAHGRMVEVERGPAYRRIEVEQESVVRREPNGKETGNAKPTNNSQAPSEDQQWQEVVTKVHNKSTKTVPATRSQHGTTESGNEEKSSESTEARPEKTRSADSMPTKPCVEPVITSRVDELRGLSRRGQGAETWSKQAHDGSQEARTEELNQHEKKGMLGESTRPAASRRPNVAKFHAKSQHVNSIAEPQTEYTYKWRTVTPVDRRWQDRHAEDDHYYRSTEEVFRRGGSGQQADDADDRTPRKLIEIRRRVSDASSRVRFSKKVDVSPTPPESDASSSDFRDFAYVKTRYDGQSAKETSKEYTSRGRSRPNERYETHEVDRDPTPRPRPHRGERPSGSSETAPLPVGASVAALSESPSREERLYSYKPARKDDHDDGYGPYSTFLYGKRCPSLLVEDGSTQASISSSSSRQHKERRRQVG